MSAPEPHKAPDVDEPPPLLGSWRALYLLLIAQLVLLTAAGYLLGWWAA
jgi:hypothetical protein